MTQVRMVLATTDFSETAGYAVERAAMLAARCGARLGIANVISRGTLNALHDLMAPDSSDELEDALVQDALAQLHQLADGVGERHGVDAEVSVSAGSVLREIDAYADAIGADLLVLGAHGASLMRDLLVGSTTERVLRRTRRPMLVVRRAPQRPYAKVLVPVDFSERSTAAIEFARNVAPEAELVLLHAYEVPYEGQLRLAGVEEAKVVELRKSAREESLKRLDRLIDETGLSGATVRRVLVQGQPASGIVEQARVLDCDLIAMGKQGLRMIEELVLGSVTRRVLEHAHCDVLVADRGGR
ncbi:MAG TPA: universal stress protein [Rhodocyclaceae bacterium]|nr:universal stress protein [Rhodocyclaceae bacterium]